VDLLSLKALPKAVQIKLLQELGYDIEGVYVFDKEKKAIHTDRYTKEKVRLDNMLIFPGSAIILDNNPLSIASYMEEYGGSI